MKTIFWKVMQEAAVCLGGILLLGAGVLVIVFGVPIIAALLGHF